MTAGESGRGALACVVGHNQQLVHHTVFPTGNGQDEVAIMHVKLYGVKVIAYIGEDALGYLVNTSSLEIELRTCYGQEVEDEIKQEERTYDDKGRTLEMLVTTEEIEEDDTYKQQIIAHIAHCHQLAEDRMREGLTERQSGLEAKERLLIAGKQVVEVGKDTVQFVGVRIPPRQQQQLTDDTKEGCQPAGIQSVDAPKGQGEYHGLCPEPEHINGMGQSHPCNKDKQSGENRVSQHDPLHRHQALPGLLLYSKYLLNQILTLTS